MVRTPGRPYGVRRHTSGAGHPTPPPEPRHFTAVASAWDHGFDVFVLDQDAVIGTTRCANRSEVVAAAEEIISEAGLAAAPHQLDVVSAGRAINH